MFAEQLLCGSLLYPCIQEPLWGKTYWPHFMDKEHYLNAGCRAHCSRTQTVESESWFDSVLKNRAQKMTGPLHHRTHLKTDASSPPLSLPSPKLPIWILIKATRNSDQTPRHRGFKPPSFLLHSCYSNYFHPTSEMSFIFALSFSCLLS